MIYEIITAVLALCLPVFTIIAYRQGVKDGRTVRQNTPFEPIIKRHKAKAPVEDGYLDRLLSNIDIYDGSGRGQVDVE